MAVDQAWEWDGERKSKTVETRNRLREVIKGGGLSVVVPLKQASRRR